MSKKALVVLAEGFEEIEAVAPIDIMRRCGIEVTVAGLTNQKIKSARGVLITADLLLKDARGDFDAVVLPGGTLGAEHLASSIELAGLVKRMHQAGKCVAAICASPALVLAPWGILSGKSVTCYPGVRDHLPDDVVYKEDAVVIDGTIITSRGPATAFAFSFAVAEALADGVDIGPIRSGMLFAE